MFFLALVCPPSLDEKIQRFKIWMKEQFGCAAALRSPAHITLVPPFWLDAARELQLFTTLQSFRTKAGDIEIHVNGFSHFGKSVLFAAVDNTTALQDIHAETEAYFSKLFPAIKKEQRPFHPHITIANRDMKPSHFEKAWAYFSNKQLDEKFMTKTITLLRHEQGRWVVVMFKTW